MVLGSKIMTGTFCNDETSKSSPPSMLVTNHMQLATEDTVRDQHDQETIFNLVLINLNINLHNYR